MTHPAHASAAREPLVSILIVNYNYDRYLSAALQSAREQTYRNVEIIVCDDGSVDRSRDIILQHARDDARIKYIFKENAAVAAALNDSFRASSGEIITMLDADDLFAREKVERVVQQFAAQPLAGLVMNTLTKIDAAGNVIGRMPEFGHYDRGDLRETVLQSSGNWAGAPTSAMTMQRGCAERVFPIPEAQFRTEADAYMRTVAALHFPVEVIDEPLTSYRVHSSNVTAPTAVDLKFCERGISASERVFSVIAAEASRHGWKAAPLSTNQAFREMLLIRDYMTRKPFLGRLRNIRGLISNARRVRAAQRRKTLAKATVISFASLLPQALGRTILNQVYLPTPLKATLSRNYRGARGR